MRVKALGFLFTIFVFLCLGGLLLGKPNKPFIQVDPCYKGYMPSIAFSANTKFLWDMSTPQFGPKYGRFNLYVIGWPGGGVMFSTNEAGICPGDSAEKTELSLLNVYWHTPASEDEEPIVGTEEVKKENEDG